MPTPIYFDGCTYVNIAIPNRNEITMPDGTMFVVDDVFATAYIAQRFRMATGVDFTVALARAGGLLAVVNPIHTMYGENPGVGIQPFRMNLLTSTLTTPFIGDTDQVNVLTYITGSNEADPTFDNFLTLDVTFSGGLATAFTVGGLIGGEVPELDGEPALGTDSIELILVNSLGDPIDCSGFTAALGAADISWPDQDTGLLLISKNGIFAPAFRSGNSSGNLNIDILAASFVFYWIIENIPNPESPQNRGLIGPEVSQKTGGYGVDITPAPDLSNSSFVYLGVTSDDDSAVLTDVIFAGSAQNTIKTNTASVINVAAAYSGRMRPGWMSDFRLRFYLNLF